MKSNDDAVQERADIIHETLQAYMDLFLLMQAATLSHWLAFELTFAQGKAVILLAAHKELTVSELARLLGVGRPTASILVQQLVERGLVTRTEHERDRRRSRRIDHRGGLRSPQSPNGGNALTRSVLASLPPPQPSSDLTLLTRGGPKHWPELIKTRAAVGADKGPFAVDVLAHPVTNPWFCQMRLSGFDFFADGDRDGA